MNTFKQYCKASTSGIEYDEDLQDYYFEGTDNWIELAKEHLTTPNRHTKRLIADNVGSLLERVKQRKLEDPEYDVDKYPVISDYLRYGKHTYNKAT